MGKNRLDQETSPYLLQHKNNPIWWFPWGNDALKAAKEKNIPIFLSIGYSTCHWCHVMEKDSFEKQDVADAMNQSFISIKVDREERPDVDHLFMSATVAVSGHGGWPMTVFLTPNGEPFWAATFIPHDSLLDVLKNISQVWKNEPDQILTGGKHLQEHLNKMNKNPRHPDFGITSDPLKNFYSDFKSRFDTKNGGSRGAPKFPQAFAVQSLLRIYKRTGNAEALQMVETTLTKMRRGGIYDQIGYGFHRYSVDDHWLVPHFEKMLYDNALLSQCYLETYLTTQNLDYLNVAEEIFDYVSTLLSAPEGGFYSAEDADSRNIEGDHYVWNPNQLESVLGKELSARAQTIFQVEDQPNFHAVVTGDEVHPIKRNEKALEGTVLTFSESEPLSILRDKSFLEIREALLKARNTRVRPHRDEKILVSWSSLMISSFAKGFQITGKSKYLERAQKCAHFILNNLKNPDGTLRRTHSRGVASGSGLAEDYAFFISALLDLYESDFDEKWFLAAKVFQRIQDDIFSDPDGGYFDGDGKDTNLSIRSKNFEDGVTPSAQSVSAMNLLRLTDFTGDAEYLSKAHEIIKSVSQLLVSAPSGVCNYLQALDRITDSSFEIAVVGDKDSETVINFITQVRAKYLPNKSLAIGTGLDSNIPLLASKKAAGRETWFYICLNQTCLNPTTDIANALKMLEDEETI